VYLNPEDLVQNTSGQPKEGEVLKEAA
jgi:hypothetical protein